MLVGISLLKIEIRKSKIHKRCSVIDYLESRIIKRVASYAIPHSPRVYCDGPEHEQLKRNVVEAAGGHYLG